MIIAYCPTVKGLERLELASGAPLPTTSVWIDLIAPTQEEQKAAEKLMGAEIPTRDEIASIETSERLYLEPGAVVMTAQLPIATQMIDPALSSVTFVVNAKRLVTVRYGEPKSIALLSRKVQADSTIAHKGPAVLFTMLDIIVDRCADEMESASARYDKLAVQVFGDGLNMRKLSDRHQATGADRTACVQDARCLHQPVADDALPQHTCQTSEPERRAGSRLQDVR